MLLNIYLGATAINCAVNFVFANAWEKKLKREGYKFVKEKKTVFENITDFILMMLKHAIPVLNIIQPIVILFMSDKVYETVKNNYLAEGKIYMATEEKPMLEEPKVYAESMDIESNKKIYGDMTLEEIDHIVDFFMEDTEKLKKRYDEMTVKEKEYIAGLFREELNKEKGSTLKRTK